MPPPYDGAAAARRVLAASRPGPWARSPRPSRRPRPRAGHDATYARHDGDDDHRAAPGVGRMLVPEAGAGRRAAEPKTLVPQVTAGGGAALVPPPIDTMAPDDPRGTTAWAAVVGGGSVFDPPFRTSRPRTSRSRAQNIIVDNARRRRRGELAERIMGAEAAPAPPPERAAPAPSAAARALMEPSTAGSGA